MDKSFFNFMNIPAAKQLVASLTQSENLERKNDSQPTSTHTGVLRAMYWQAPALLVSNTSIAKVETSIVAVPGLW